MSIAWFVWEATFGTLPAWIFAIQSRYTPYFAIDAPDGAAKGPWWGIVQFR